MTDKTRFGKATRLLLSGVLAGLALAAAVFPANAVLALTAKSASDAFLDLPSDLQAPPTGPAVLPLRQRRQDADHHVLRREPRATCALDQVAPVMQQAIVAAEDARFYQHGGVDLKGVRARAGRQRRAAARPTQGASTLTMQYVRNVLKTDPT